MDSRLVQFGENMSFKRKEDREDYWIKALQDEECSVSQKRMLQSSISAATFLGWKPGSIKWWVEPRNALQDYEG
jgi:hypothetical protein